MLKKSLSLAAAGFLTSVCLLSAAPHAMADGRPHVNFGVTIGTPYPAPPPVVYVQPQPVYVQPEPYYVRPRPVYVQPAPVVEYRRDYYGRPYYEERVDYGNYWRHRRHHRHHHDD